MLFITDNFSPWDIGVFEEEGTLLKMTSISLDGVRTLMAQNDWKHSFAYDAMRSLASVDLDFTAGDDVVVTMKPGDLLVMASSTGFKADIGPVLGSTGLEAGDLPEDVEISFLLVEIVAS